MEQDNAYEGCWDKYNVVDMCSWQFLLMSISLGLITLAVVVGNSLVITAVFLYRKLRKSISNSFIASLAVADLMLGVVVLPFSVALEIMGYWVFGPFFCQIWLVVDVWVCTASILHLCVISMDRFIAIAYPLKYPHLMTFKRCRLLCLASWTLSFIVCLPSLVDWGVEDMEQATKAPLANITLLLMSNATLLPEEPPQCNVVAANSQAYIIYSACGSFFVPSLVMTGFYVKIFLVARKFTRQSLKGSIAKAEGGASLRVHRGRSHHNNNGAYTNHALTTDKHKQASSVQVSESSVDIRTPDDDEKSVSRYSENGMTSREGSVKSRATIDRQLISSVNPRRTSKPSIGQTLNKETRAAKTVAIIVGCFIACWTPFFICYVMMGTSDIPVSYQLFHAFIWIGYLNSLLNPCIYACFATDYRHAFKKILKCEVRSSANRRHGVLSYLGSLYVSNASTSRPEYNYSIPKGEAVPKLVEK